MGAARETLTAVGAVDADGRVTDRGVRMSRLGLHPRLARALLDGAAEVGGRRAAEVVALLSEEPPREYGDDLAAALRTARRGGDGYAARWRQEVRRLSSSIESSGEGAGRGGSDEAAVGLVAALAFPERVARARGEGAFLMASGTGAELRDGSRLRSAPWLAVAVADRPAHAASAGCGSPPSSTRTRRGWRPGICGSPVRRSAGWTATWWRARWNGWAPSNCRCVR